MHYHTLLQRGGYLARVDVHISSGAQRSSSLAFEDWVALLVDREAAHRDSRRLTRPLAKARFKYVIFAPRFVFHCPWNPDSKAVSMSS
ncbi:MAG: hypothetical protein E6K24_01670, partial [Gammaproteobacteria bacterium]